MSDCPDDTRPVRELGAILAKGSWRRQRLSCHTQVCEAIDERGREGAVLQKTDEAERDLAIVPRCVRGGGERGTRAREREKKGGGGDYGARRWLQIAFKTRKIAAPQLS